jgi:hypothetical protein
MFVLHIIVVVSGMTTVGMWRMVFSRRCVPPLSGTWLLYSDCDWSVGTQVPCPHVPAELGKSSKVQNSYH